MSDFEISMCVINSLLRSKRATNEEIDKFVNNTLDTFCTTFFNFVKRDFENSKEKNLIEAEFNNLHEKWFSRSKCITLSAKAGHMNNWNHDLLKHFESKRPVGRLLNKYIDNYFLDTELSSVIRKRNNFARNLLIKTVDNIIVPCKTIDILDAGSASYLAGANTISSLHLSLKKKLFLTIVNNNKTANTVFKKWVLTRNIEYLIKNVNILKEVAEKGKIRCKEQNIIMVIGLCDFADDEMFVQLINAFYNILKMDKQFIRLHIEQ